MKRLLKGLTLLGVAAGTAYAVKNYLGGPDATDDAVQISFGDGTSETLGSAEAEEFTDIASGVLWASGR